MTKREKTLILILFFVTLAGFLFWKWWDYNNPSIFTNKRIYKNGESLIVTIKNPLQENICFSRCYPYYMEKKNSEWESYQYRICEKEDLNDICVEHGEVRAFEIDLLFMEEGLHRLALPACFGCNVGEQFKEIKRFYSNQFTIEEK